jgi:hypothetical protein
MYELEVMDYLADENDMFSYQEYTRISKTKYNKININYDILYLNKYFNPFNQQTIKSKNIVEVWKCSI